MKNRYLLLFALFLNFTVIRAQNVADYSFNVSTGVALEDISAGSTLLFGIQQDDVSTNAIDLPFVFQFAGINYTQFSVSTNGLIGFGSVPVTNIGVYNLLHESETFPILAAWWEDLYTASNGSIKYKIVGNPGQRKLIVEWHVRKFKASTTLLYNKTFQAWLFEGTNKVQFVYGTGVVDIFTAASIGAAGSATDYLCLNSANNTVSSTVSENTGAWPGSGTSYVFSPFSIPTATIIANGPTTFYQGGSVTLLASTESSEPLTYQWNKDNNVIPGATESSYLAYQTGSYLVIVTFASGSVTTEPINVIANPLPSFNREVSNVSCAGGHDGSINITGGNGQDSYTYVLQEQNVEFPLQQSNQQGFFEGLDAGLYEVTITGPNMPEIRIVITLTQPDAISVDGNGSVIMVSCNGESNGSATLGTVSGGDGNYTINWTRPNGYTGLGSAINDLASGTYQYSVTDSKNCTPVTGEVTITEPASLTLSLFPTNIKCNGTNGGSIAVSNSAGSTVNIIDVNGIDVTATNGQYGPGVYTVIANAANGNNDGNCTITGTVTITEPVAVTVSASSTNVSCNGANDGHITVTSNGTYEIRNANAVNVTNNVSFTAGVYTITATNPGGNDGDVCSPIPLTVTITEPIVLTAVIISIDHVNANGVSNGSVTIRASGGTSPYTYSLQGITNEIGTFNGLAAGSYTIVVTDAHGCNLPVIVIIVTPTVLNATVSSTNGTCNGFYNGIIEISNPDGGSGTFEYRLNGGSWQTSGNFTELASGAYNVQMRDASQPNIVKDLISTTITQSGAAPIVTISPAAPAFCTNLILTASPAAAYSYAWNNGGNMQTMTLSSTHADGNYSVTVANSNGCTGSATYNFIKQNMVNSYTIIGFRDVIIGESNKVNGAVGDTTKGKKITINKNSVINGFVKASVISLSQPVSVSGGLFSAPVNVTLPMMYNNTSSTSGLNNLTLADDYSGPAISGNYNQVTVGKRSHVTITGNVYGKIIIREAADVIFTTTDISIGEIQTDHGKTLSTGIDYTTITFSSPAIIRIKNKVTLGDRNTFNGSGSVLYVGDGNTDGESITINGKSTVVNANIYMPHGTMAVKGADATNNCTINGMIISENITSEKFVNWNGYNCNVGETGSSSAGNGLFAEEGASSSQVSKLKVYPNPGFGEFTLQLNNDKNAKAEVIILNQNGAEVMHQKAMQVDAGQLIKLNLRKQSAGVYMVKVIIGDEVQVTRIVVKK